MDYNAKKIVIADLDGTLTKSKTRMDGEMSNLIGALLGYKDMAVISGGSYAQFQKQFITSLPVPEDRLARLYLFPTNATSFYKFVNGGWAPVYIEALTETQKKKIFEAFDKALRLAHFERPEKLYGELIEDRGTQVTFSAYGQQAPLEIKEKWDPDQKKRLLIKRYLDEIIPEFKVKIGGTTSIDVTRKGIDKAYAIRKINEIFGYSIEQMVFLGDAIFEGGNDYAVKAAGVDSIKVGGPEDTKKILSEIIEVSKKNSK